ncbi:MAG: hypothetical protein HY585_00675, partial [Candidatus Omnitrophica bacterium]|nr:hypothetical protein [Candidatus Omnitrophota bacterium]
PIVLTWNRIPIFADATQTAVWNGTSPLNANEPDGVRAFPGVYFAAATLAHAQFRGNGQSFYLPQYQNLYSYHYSGGFDNLVNLQERWFWVTIRFYGTFAALWHSKELSVGDKAAVYDTSYYKEPWQRDFEYLGSLRDNPPPGTGGGGSLSITRGKWREL